eukprot:Nitzschia sp. Nitz4//scaffold96_size78090//20687//21285//NITZ4_005488-RA/size78090-augustus-gene-0.12-mRNA-1//-1//CDS//3329560555//937//frame0
MGDEYVGYKSPSSIVAETVYHFLRGGLYGAAFGLVTPFPAPGSAAAIKEATTGVFRPVPPFQSLSSIPINALTFGSLLAAQRFGALTAEFSRGIQDPWNDVFGCAVAYPYYQSIICRYPIWHNRVVGGGVLFAVAYANLSSN